MRPRRRRLGGLKRSPTENHEFPISDSFSQDSFERKQVFRAFPRVCWVRFAIFEPFIQCVSCFAPICPSARERDLRVGIEQRWNQSIWNRLNPEGKANKTITKGIEQKRRTTIPSSLMRNASE